MVVETRTALTIELVDKVGAGIVATPDTVAGVATAPACAACDGILVVTATVTAEIVEPA